MKWYLMWWVIGSIIIQTGLYMMIGRNVAKSAAVFCVSVTFSLLITIEFFATRAGIWSWSPDVTLYKIGNIPVEEMMLYITSAITTILFFETIRWIFQRSEK
ncbi:MAG: hypothetical protein GX089_09645 [Fibrobacter sp.]|jgi:hypothetical protein|nr:hypothetical protein [Fibrobacter sp.]HON10534.1 hypothetical protein [Chitinispirillaceae bacterium]